MWSGTVIAILLAPVAGDLLNRWQERRRPFDGSWTFARIVTFCLPNRGRGSKTAIAEEGGQPLRRLAAPAAEHQQPEKWAVDELLRRASGNKPADSGGSVGDGTRAK